MQGAVRTRWFGSAALAGLVLAVSALASLSTGQPTSAATTTTEPASAAHAPYGVGGETLNLVERLHRQLLDVIKDELDRRDERDINSVQALLLFNVGDQELTAGELRTLGHYLGSNVSYNLKKLVEGGYIHHERSEADRGDDFPELRI